MSSLSSSIHKDDKFAHPSLLSKFRLYWDENLVILFWVVPLCVKIPFRNRMSRSKRYLNRIGKSIDFPCCLLFFLGVCLDSIFTIDYHHLQNFVGTLAGTKHLITIKISVLGLRFVFNLNKTLFLGWCYFTSEIPRRKLNVLKAFARIKHKF